MVILHQDYLAKHPERPSCHAPVPPMDDPTTILEALAKTNRCLEAICFTLAFVAGSTFIAAASLLVVVFIK